MIEQVEIGSFDLRFEGYRLRNRWAEGRLLASISEQGIRDPLKGVDSGEERILLDGFKRYRCARRMGIGIVPYHALSTDTALGIGELLRMSNNHSLSIVEQARLIDELKEIHHMSTADIAQILEKSKAWVSVRSGIIREMSQKVMEAIFSGRFPVYAYMYVLRPFIRINRVCKEEIEAFVELASGEKLSIREIELLAKVYFNSSEETRNQLREGNISFFLSGLKEKEGTGEGCTKKEGIFLKDLEMVKVYMERVMARSQESVSGTNTFFVQANLLTEGILSRVSIFSHTVKELYDRSGKA